MCHTSCMAAIQRGRLTCRSSRSACAAGVGVCCLRSPWTLCRLLWWPTGPCCMASYTFWSTLTALKATYLQLIARSSSCGQQQSHNMCKETCSRQTAPIQIIWRPHLWDADTLLVGEFSAAQHNCPASPTWTPCPTPLPFRCTAAQRSWVSYPTWVPPECRARLPALSAAC